MRLFEDPQLGPILVAPAPLLRSLLLRIVSQSNPSNGLLTEPSPTGEETEVPKIVLCPLTTETAEELMNPLTRASPFPILVLCDTEGFQALVSLEGPDVEGYEEVVNAAFRVATEEIPGQFTAAGKKISAGATLGELLSRREVEVLEQLALGSSNNQIAEVLSITPNTVYTHVRHIKAKLSTSNRTQTALVARTMLNQSQ